MKAFFNPAEHEELIIPMYGTTHFITLAVLVLALLVLLLNRKRVKKIVRNTKALHGIVWGFVGIEILYWALSWIYKVEPFYERFPLHLCGTMAIIMPVLILTKKYKWFRFFSYWSVCAGFISFVNPSFIHDEPWSFAFIQYLVRHYFLFLIPFAIQIGREFKHTYKDFITSLATLAVYSFLIFLLNWATGANFMHLGQNNPLEIPFLPKSFTVWPYTYPSFVGVGLILLHFSYLGFKAMERRDEVKI